MDKLHRVANARSYRAAVNDAHRIVERALAQFGEPAAVGVSGGKDSVAMCHVVAQHCRPAIIWNDSGLELPESEGIVLSLSKTLRLDVHVARGNALNRTLARESVTDEANIIEPVRQTLHALGTHIEFVGLRASESKRRKMVLRMHGPIYNSKRWDCGIAWPMRQWSAADVFAYIDEHGLPLHPAYLRTQWATRDQIRVSWAWDSDRERVGDLEYLRRFYPQLHQKIRGALNV